MSPKQAIDGVVSRLTGPMGDRGFQYVKARRRFERQSDGHLDVFSLTANPLGEAAELRPFLSMRLDAIEELVSRASDGAPTPFSVSLSREVAHVTGDKEQWRPRIADQAGLDSAAEIMLRAVDGPGEEFYRKYGQMAAVDEYLNSFPEQAAFMAGTALDRAKAGMVAARLVQRQDEFRLIDGFRRFLRNLHESDVQLFDRFVDRLDTILPKT
jgi:hypothetical protein